MPDSQTLRRVALTTPDGLIAFGFGSGLAPKAPGTVGSIAAVAPFMLLVHQPWWLYVAVVLFSFVLGVWVCERASRRLGVHDHGGIVWDEFVGLWIALFACPRSWWALLAGFLLFRFFDIIKPWPIGWLDRRVKGGLGIMIDDVIAGIYAFAVLQTALRLFD